MRKHVENRPPGTVRDPDDARRGEFDDERNERSLPSRAALSDSLTDDDDGYADKSRRETRTRAGVPRFSASSARNDRDDGTGARERRAPRTEERNRREERPDDPRRASLIARYAAAILGGRQLSRTKWPFAVSSLARGPGDGARVRSSLARADDEKAILRSGRSPRSLPSSLVIFPTVRVSQSLFDIFAHTYARDGITRARKTDFARCRSDGAATRFVCQHKTRRDQARHSLSLAINAAI